MVKDAQKTRIGRPPVANPKNIRLSLAIDDATYRELKAESERTGVPIAEIARKRIERKS